MPLYNPPTSGAVEPATLISADVDNALVEGGDGKLFAPESEGGSTPGAVRVIGPWTIYFRKWQTIVAGGDAGTYTLDYDGNETAAIAWDADAATIQAALIAAAPALAGHVTVSGDVPGSPVNFLFDDTIIDPPLLVADAANLTAGGGPTTVDVFITSAELGREIYTPEAGEWILDMLVQQVEGITEGGAAKVYLADAIDGEGLYESDEISLKETADTGTTFSTNAPLSMMVLVAQGAIGNFPTRSLNGSPLFAVLSEAGGSTSVLGTIKIWIVVATPVAP